MNFQHIKNNQSFLYLLFFIIININNCFSLLKPPAITFTQSPSSAEKQIIGDNKELESDGWLLSSIKTSAIGPVEWRRENFDEFESTEIANEYKLYLKIILHTTPEIKKLKQLKYLGEALNGSLAIIENKRDPKFDKVYSTIEEINRVKDLVSLVNDTRQKIKDIRKKIINYDKSKVYTYLNTVEYGEYFEEKKGIWILKE
jgi:hypothetical protein